MPSNVRWRKAADDGTAWVADPEPDYHLAVWRASKGHIGWDWHVVDKAGEVLVGDWGEYEEADAKAKAEAWYLAHRASR